MFLATCNCNRIGVTELFITVHHGHLLLNLPAIEHHIIALNKCFPSLELPSHIDSVLMVEGVESLVAVLSDNWLGHSDVSLAEVIFEHIQPVSTGIRLPVAHVHRLLRAVLDMHYDDQLFKLLYRYTVEPVVLSASIKHPLISGCDTVEEAFRVKN